MEDGGGGDGTGEERWRDAGGGGEGLGGAAMIP